MIPGSKFTKSKSNSGTEKEGMGLLLADRRFQRVDLLTKRRILELIGKSTAFGIQTFDAVMTLEPTEEINVYNVERRFKDLRLIEMKYHEEADRKRQAGGLLLRRDRTRV